MSAIFGSIIHNSTITATSFFGATLCSLVIGMLIAYVYMKVSSYSKSYIVTLVLLPVVVQVIIMMVNGNIGAGVAVAGAFGLVRFRSAQGSGQEITGIFLAMAVGLATGMGYVGLAILFTAVVMLAYYLLNKSSFGDPGVKEKLLKVTVPETLDFEGIFDDILAKYTTKAELTDVRTTGMGSLYKLSYKINLRDGVSQKAMIDEMRTRNGNLEISCSRPVQEKTEEL